MPFPPRSHTLTLLALAAAFGAALGWQQSAASSSGDPTVYETSSALAHVKIFQLPRKATHVALHWRGERDARVRVAFSRDGRQFGRTRQVELDEVGEQLRARETYGAIMAAAGARAVRVWSDRRLSRVTVLAFSSRGLRTRPPSLVRTLAGAAQPTVIPRAGWGAVESLRFDATGKEIWPSAFYPIQKVIVHHTATQNNDPDAAATIRSIYYYHAVTQGWGDLGYNFLIDEAGNVYEGRYSRLYASDESPTGQDLSGNGVTGAHAQGYNSGTVGIALLGTLTNQDATPAARSALERLIAWIDSSSIDPQGSSLYTNPVSGFQATFPNIAGHRDIAATECPGGALYATLPAIRSAVAALIASATPDFAVSVSPSSRSVRRGRATSYTVSVSSQGGSDFVSLSVSGLPFGAEGTFSPTSLVPPGRSLLTVRTSAQTPRGTFTLTISGAGGTLSRAATVSLTVK